MNDKANMTPKIKRPLKELVSLDKPVNMQWQMERSLHRRLKAMAVLADLTLPDLINASIQKFLEDGGAVQRCDQHYEGCTCKKST